MEPTVGNAHAALNGSRERRKAEDTGEQGALGQPAGSEPAAGKSSLLRAGLRRLQPGRLARATIRRVEGLWRRHPLEAATLTLMALAGLAYPFPFWWLDFAVWLIGAGIALSSQLWDLRDKWTALAGPVALVVAGTAITLAAGGAHATMAGYIHEGQTGSLYLIKGCSLAGAGYLAWRVHRGRRTPLPPPWRRPPRR